MITLCAGISVFFLSFAIFAPDGPIHDAALAWFISLPFCCLGAASGIYYVQAYFRERLILTSTSLKQHTVMNTKGIQYSDISNVDWLSLFGALIIQAGDVPIKIHLGNFGKSEQAEIVEVIREAVPEERQENWDIYEQVEQERNDPTLRIEGIVSIGIFAFLWLLWELGVSGKLLLFVGVPSCLILPEVVGRLFKWWFKYPSDTETEIDPPQA